MTEPLNQEQLRDSLFERFLRPGPLAIADVAEDVVESDADLTPPPGTITVFFARDPQVLAELGAALALNDGAGLAAVRVRADEARGALPESDDAARSSVHAAGTVFDVRYAGRTIAGNRVLPEGELLGSVVLSWTGGALDDDAFSVVEYGTEELAEQELAYQAYRRRPVLTELEQAMLERLPAELAEVNLGTITASETKTMEEIARIVEREAKHAVQTRTCGPENLDALQELIEGELISPEASVRELVRARLDLMTQSRLRRAGR
ncbi:hypothetical protein EDD29_4500 [Actinocorallia herbida]|uniref:Uncharacterized protein n=1 Tax=Actinocorallia herbida TaxID=58109 RepID=A0A3N1D085_9ACTN|nr:hypothetical protein [Actinocorallia herbida]ROO86916.1 hypothetical protein EDD29_4500 [Actinocorallia herbida]